MNPRIVWAAGALLSLACLLSLGAQARAAYDPIASGTTKISLDPKFLALLNHNGVKLKAKGGATLTGKTLSFPLTGGKFDPLAGTGTVEQEGSLIFRGTKGSIPLRSLQLKTTQRHAPFSGKLGGSQLKLFSTGTLKIARVGFGDKVTATRLALSAKVAGRFAKKLHLPGVFEPGEAFGSSTTKAQPATVTILPQGKATLVLDPAFAAKLGKLFVSRNPIFPAEHQGDAFTLPIAAGQLSPDGSQGTLRTGGSIELLQLGAGQLFWHEFWFQPGQAQALAESELDPSPPYPGKQGQVGIFALGQGQASSDPAARTIAVAGAPLTLSALTAQDLNEAFSRPLGKGDMFAPGDAAGTVSFTAQGQ